MTTYTGTNGDNTINGSNGDDTISGLGGQDNLSGGNGNDTISGGAGDDTIDGGNSNDNLSGDGGNDNIDGGNGNDTIDGGADNDTITGGNGNDTLFGSAGNDTLTGENGDDDITGGGGDDIIDGSNGHDTAYYSGPIGEYSFFSSGGYLHVVHLGGAGADGHDQIKRVERLVFADRVIEIGSGHNAPVAGDDHVFINEDTGTYSSGAASVKDNDFDFDGDTMTVTPGVFVGTYGTLTLNANGTYSYTLNASAQALDDGENVQDSFNYTVSDNDGSDTGTLVFHIAGLNDAPVANDDTASTTENAAVSGNVLANDTDVDVETLVVANPGTYVGANGTLVLAANGSYTYTPNAAAQALDDGEVVSDVFSYTASDGTASDTATLTVTVNGVNDAPVANDDTASTTEEASVSGNVLTNDTDVDVEPLTVANPGTYAGTYGTLTLAADGSYTYAPNAAAQGLDTGEVAQDVFTYAASDGTASDTATLTVSVNGLNDAPVANDDTAATDENTSVSGNVLANDTDVDVETLTVTNPGTYIGAYGTLVLAANGSYTYTPTGAAQALNDGQVVNDVFGYIASDGTASDAATLTITVTGLGGVPHANDDTASTTEDASVSGNVLTNDTDDELDPLTVSNPGTYVGTYGTLTLAANGSYTYTPNAAADGLAVGESAQDVFTYTATDGTGSDTATLTVTVNGTNDAPTIDAGGTDANGAVTELPDGDPNENVTVHSDSGAVAFDDLDLSDTHSASFTPQGGGYLGTFTLDPVDQPGDSVGWDFTVSDAALEGLSEGQVVTQTYTVEIDDGHGGTVTQDVTITINGTGVGTGPQTVWYIDNSAVGSTNVGTQANPYTSIAAFNAAQNSVGGPQVGHTVHLLAGTGTGVYAEADGINLLNGQILVGDANGAVRPTIEAAAGDGINVAQNNDISGLDIGNTSGADIADSGGSVGTLTISNVGTSGTGQIIDVDQGGTLDVTLNGAESLGSSGGAVDLAGVGGSFTVTGATTITGLHSGGGIDITGSSVAATFAGGGAVATLTTTAVNYVGNSGSLALGGGFGIVTTSGAGLNATGGGTVTVTGAGNSIVSTTGTALNVDNTNIGAADLTFVSISSNGAASGIVLNNTGSSGGLTVTGTGAADSGGVIQNSTGDGIRLTSTQDVSLTEVKLLNSADNNVDATNVTNLTLDSLLSDGSGNTNLLGSGITDLTISNGSAFDHSGNGVGDHGIFITNLFGTSSITSTSFANSAETEVRITNTAATVAQGSLAGDVLTMSAVTFALLSGGVTGDNIQINANLAANMHFILDGSVGANTIAGGITGVLVNANSGGDIDVDIANTTITAGTGAGINFSAVGAGSRIWFDAHDNVLTGRNAASLNATSINNAILEGRFTDNSITQGANGNGITIIAEGTGAAGTASATVSATDNTITGVQNGGGINAQARLGGILNLTLDDNHVNINNALNLEGIRVVSGASAGDNTSAVRLNMHDNDVTVGPASGQESYALQVRGTNLFQLQDFTGNGNNADTVDEVNWIDVVKNNSLFDGVSTPTIQIQHTGGGVFTASAGAIPTPILPSPLLADPASPPPAADNIIGLTQGQLDVLVEAAIQRWGDAGLASEQLAEMCAVSVSIADMAGSNIGSAIRGHISVDFDAGGYGWFVDSTPGDDSEFIGSGTRLTADAGGAADGRMDLLSVIMHELGHQIGLEDSYDAADANALMHGYLAAGERHLPDGMFEAETGQAALGDMPLHSPALPLPLIFDVPLQ